MKKYVALLFGLLVAVAAAWAIPKEIEKAPVKIDILDILTAEAVMDNAIEMDISSAVQQLSDQGATQILDYPLTPRQIELPFNRWRTLERHEINNSLIKPKKQLGSWKYRIRINQHRL